MKPYFTCVDVLGYDGSHDFYEPTIYEVSGITIPQAHIRDEVVINPASLGELNSTLCHTVHYVQRTKGSIFSTLEGSDGDVNILFLHRSVNNLGREGNTSNLQRMWGQDMRLVFRSTAQFPPFAEYYTSIDRLFHELEMQFRRIDSGDMSQKFWPHNGFMSSGIRHGDTPGYLDEVPNFPELPNVITPQ